MIPELRKRSSHEQTLRLYTKTPRHNTDTVVAISYLDTRPVGWQQTAPSGLWKFGAAKMRSTFDNQIRFKKREYQKTVGHFLYIRSPRRTTSGGLAGINARTLIHIIILRISQARFEAREFSRLRVPPESSQPKLYIEDSDYITVRAVRLLF